MAEFAQLKVELAKALEAQTGSQSEQINLAQRTSELVTKGWFFSSNGVAVGVIIRGAEWYDLVKIKPRSEQ